MKFLIALIAVIAIAQFASAETGMWARADIFMLNPSNGALGLSYATFRTLPDDQVEVHIYISGIPSGLRPDGEHGIHVHTYGDMSFTNGTSLGPHWDPEGQDHGCGVVGAAGDLGNFTAVAGEINETRVYESLALSGPNSIVGRGIVLHLNPDNCETVSSAGARIAAGVIGVQQTSTPDINNAAPPSTWPGTSSVVSAACVLQPTITHGNGAAGIWTWSQQATTEPVSVRGYLNKNGTFGVHVHAWGDLSDRDAALNTGGHWDPLATGVHGLPSSTEAHHAGDMGNTNPDLFDGTNMGYEAVFATQTLTGPNSVIGRAFVVHAGVDDGTGTSGNAGVRQAQCVVGLAQNPPSAPVAPVPTPLSSASSLTFSLALVAVFAVLGLFL